ncbi:MAG: hemolysin family protein, partial [Candidatus Aureabacteria bacterium]|nr:hemolysin family protein [Candidatus Auribacterota bacterium]
NLLATTLVGYNLAVVIGSCVLNNIISHYAPPNTENIFSLLIYWPLVLVIGQIVPMAYGRQHANRLSLAVARPLRLAYRLLFPLAYMASLLGRGITRLFTRGRVKKNPFVTREELELMLKESHEAGALPREEKEMIEEIFHFGETSVRSIMVPLIEVTAAADTATVAQARRIIEESGHSRLPLYRHRVDHIVGTLHATDLIGIPDDSPVAPLMHTPYFVPLSVSIGTILVELQRNHAYMAIVVDEYGGVTGILTLEDIIEEIVGDIDDEYDTETAPPWRKTAEGRLVEGRMRVHDFNEEFAEHLPEEGPRTIAGFMTALLKRVPRVDDEVRFEHMRFKVIEATDRRAVKVEVTGFRKNGM